MQREESVTIGYHLACLGAQTRSGLDQLQRRGCAIWTGDQPANVFVSQLTSMDAQQTHNSVPGREMAIVGIWSVDQVYLHDPRAMEDTCRARAPESGRIQELPNEAGRPHATSREIGVARCARAIVKAGLGA